MQLSGAESMRLTHQLRACCQSILVGIGTVLADNPSLTVRRVEGQNPQPIILDTRLRTPLDANLVKRPDLSTWIVNGNHDTGDPNERSQTKGRNADQLPLCRRRVDRPAGLDGELANRQVDSVMVERSSHYKLCQVEAGGFICHHRFSQTGRRLPVIDAESFKAAPFPQLKEVHYQQLGQDLVIWARPAWNDL